MDILKRSLKELTNSELLDLLDEVSQEVKERNSLMANHPRTIESAAADLLQKLFPPK